MLRLLWYDFIRYDFIKNQGQKLETLIFHRKIFFSDFRNVLGTKNLGDILSERESIATMMQSTLDEATDPWGVKVERVEV